MELFLQKQEGRRSFLHQDLLFAPEMLYAHEIAHVPRPHTPELCHQSLRKASSFWTEIDPQDPSMHLLSRKLVPGPQGTLNIDKVCMRKSSAAASPPIDGDAHVDDILDILEQLVQVLIGYIEWHVAYVESFRRRVFIMAGLRLLEFPGSVVYIQTATPIDLIAQCLDCLCGGFDISKVDEAISMPQQSELIFGSGGKHSTVPTPYSCPRHLLLL
jgi:hypothetical protein